MKKVIFYLGMKKLFGLKNRTIRNIPDYNIDILLIVIRNK